MDSIGLILLLVTLIPVILFTMFIPYITRKTESFGVSIPEDQYHHPDIVRFRKKYMFQMALLGIVVLVPSLIFSFYVNENGWAILLTVATFLFLIASFIIYLFFHSKMKALKAASDWQQTKSETMIIDTKFRDKKVTFSNHWFLIPLFVTAATMITTFMLYDQIPNKIPMKYDFSGNVTNWAEKSYRTMLIFPVMQLFMIGLFMYINGTIRRSKQQIDVASPERSMMQNVVFRRRWSLYLIATGTATVFMFSVIQLSFLQIVDQKIITIPTLIIVAAIVLGAVILTFTTGQGGSRVRMTGKENEERINRDDDQYWKLGIFYFNRHDPSLWVEKRFGSGWTFNMANLWGWIFLAVIILIPLAIVFFLS